MKNQQQTASPNYETLTRRSFSELLAEMHREKLLSENEMKHLEFRAASPSATGS